MQQPHVPHFLALTSVCLFVGFSFPLSSIVLHTEPVPLHFSRPHLLRVYRQGNVDVANVQCIRILAQVFPKSMYS